MDKLLNLVAAVEEGASDFSPQIITNEMEKFDYTIYASKHVDSEGYKGERFNLNPIYELASDYEKFSISTGVESTEKHVEDKYVKTYVEVMVKE